MASLINLTILRVIASIIINFSCYVLSDKKQASILLIESKEKAFSADSNSQVNLIKSERKKSCFKNSSVYRQIAPFRLK